MMVDESKGSLRRRAEVGLATPEGIGGASASNTPSTTLATATAIGVLSTQSMNPISQAARHFSAVEEAMRPYRELDDRMKHLTALAGGHPTSGGVADQFAEQQRALEALRIPVAVAELAIGLPSKAMDAASRATGHLPNVDEVMRSLVGIDERMKNVAELAGGYSGLGKVAQQISEQQRAIDALRNTERSHIHASDFKIPELPPNPILETNRRLERIERGFDEMQEIATGAATIATGLQAHAAEFLVKFEKAATDNDRSAGRAILLGGIAILIAVAMPLAQIIHTEFWRVPRDAADLQAVIIDMHGQIASLRQTQVEAAERIGVALEHSDQQTADALRHIGRLLVEQRPDVAVPKPPEE